MSDTVGALHRFEQRLEQMVTGAFARAFRSAVQPMEIAAALQREVDNSAQILSRDRRLAPNNFMIDLSGPDFDRLSTYGDTLSRELASMLHEHAQEQHYMFAGPISMNFTRADDLTTGRFRVRSEASAAVTPVAGQQMSDTLISRAPMFLEINGTRHPLEPPGLTIGRGTNADLRIDDPGVSRRHVEFRVQRAGARHAVGQRPRPRLHQRHHWSTANASSTPRSSNGSVVQIGSTRIVVACRRCALRGRRPSDESGPATYQPGQQPPPQQHAGTTGSGRTEQPPAPQRAKYRSRFRQATQAPVPRRRPADAPVTPAASVETADRCLSSR